MFTDVLNVTTHLLASIFATVGSTNPAELLEIVKGMNPSTLPVLHLSIHLYKPRRSASSFLGGELTPMLLTDNALGPAALLADLLGTPASDLNGDCSILILILLS